GARDLRSGPSPGDQRGAEDRLDRELLPDAFGRFGECVEESQRARRMVRRLAVAVVAQGIVRRLCPVLDRALEVPALLEVHRKLAGDLGGGRTAGRLQPSD